MGHNLEVWSGAPFTNMDSLQSQHGYVITCPVKCGMYLPSQSQTSMCRFEAKKSNSNEASGARLTKAYDVTIQRDRNPRAKNRRQ